MSKKLSFKQLDIQIGQKIKGCRQKANYSQTNLAELLKYESPTAISLIESGERSLKIHDLIILCQLFDKDYNHFIGRPSEHKNRII
ncbi:helix-turn-helix domain-containing protein [Patescibacteria group bacterium]|nr:helix-turn-helix domain-containing protein [Patescibacteria group bacterium]